jgi:hypothetical protein
MTTIGGSGSLAYACACNRAAGYTVRVNSWSCEPESPLSVDDDLALVDAISNYGLLQSLNATVVAQAAMIATQNTRINTLIALLRTAAATASTPPQTAVSSTSVSARQDGSMIMSGQGAIAVETNTCTNADLCDAASFAATLKTSLTAL